MDNDPKRDVPDNGGWAAPRVAFLDKLIAAARKDGRHPDGHEAETIDVLKTYISKDLPGSNELRAKLDELHAVLYGNSHYSTDTTDNIYIAWHNDPDWPDVDKIKRRLEEKAKKDDEDIPTRENISDFSKWPAFQQKVVNVAPITALKNKLRAVSSPGEIIKLMSEHHATITIDHKFYIIQDLGLGAPVGLISEETFIKQFKNCKFGIKDSNEKPINVAIIWLNSPQIRECSEFIFDPQHEYDPYSSIFNKWRGFGTEDKAFDQFRASEECSLILSYYWNDICSGDAKKFAFMMGWCAHMRQKPWEKPEVAFALTGPKGIGKSMFFWILKRLLDGKTRAGRAQKYYHKVAKVHGLLPRFNPHLEENILLVSEEVSLVGDKELRGAISDFITSDTVTIEIKNGPIRDVVSYSRMGITINDDHFVTATSDERRYGIFKVSDAHQGNKAYFRAIIKELNEGGAEALMHIFKTWDISDFDPRQYPETAELGGQKVGSFVGQNRWWYNKLQDGRVPLFEELRPDGSCRVITDKLSHDYIKNEKDATLRAIFSMESFGKQLKKVCPGIIKGDKIKNDPKCNLGSKAKYIWVYTLPSLIECRRMFEEAQKCKIDWNEDVTEWDGEIIWIVDGPF
jgi:hypothetical protein